MNNSPRLNLFQQFLSVNKIINGGLDFWQRNSTFNIATGNIQNQYLADRFFITHETSNSGSVDVEQIVNSSPNAKTPNAIRIEVTSADDMSTVSDYSVFGQHMEGNFSYDLLNKTAIFRTWVRTNKTGIYSFCFTTQNGENYLKEVDITLADSWQEVVVEIPVDYFGDNGIGIGMTAYIVLASGSDRRGDTNDSWNLSTPQNYRASNNQVNLYSDVGNYIEFSEVMVFDKDFGSIFENEVPFSRAGRNYSEELVLCQRYFEKTYPLDIRPGLATGLGEVYYYAATNFANAGALHIQFAVSKRVQPVYTPYSTVTFDAPNTFNNASIGQNFSASGTNASEHGVTMLFGPSATLTAGQLARWHWTAQAEL
jgi:hypothetical protein